MNNNELENLKNKIIADLRLLAAETSYTDERRDIENLTNSLAEIYLRLY